MQLLIKLRAGLVQLPDNVKYFKNQERVEINDELYLLCDYTGYKGLTSDYDVNTYLNSLPNENVPTPGIRKITVGAFYKRLGDKFPAILALSDSLASQGDYTLKANLMRIDKSEFVDLDEPDLDAGLRATTLFNDEELTLIFKDGEPSEVPEILKLGVPV